MTTSISNPRDRRVRLSLIALAIIELFVILALLWLSRHPAAAIAPCPTAQGGESASTGGGGGPGAGAPSTTSDGPGSGGAGSLTGSAAEGGTKPVAAAGSGPSAGTGAADGGGTPPPLAIASPPTVTTAKAGAVATDPPPSSSGRNSRSTAETSNSSAVKSSRDFANDASELPHYPGAIPGSIASATADGSTAGIDAGTGAVFTTNDPLEKVAAWYTSHLPATWSIERAPAQGADIVMFSPRGDNPHGVGIVLLQAAGKPTAIVDQAGG